MKKAILFICLLLIGTLSCTQPKVFFEKFNIGDKLEECLANGLIESSGGQFEWELTDSDIKTYFQRTGVVFDNNNTIQEIELLAYNYTNLNTNQNVDVSRSFNYMLQYFSQRYSGMKKGEFDTKDDTTYCLYEVGTEYVWNTPDLTIRVQLFHSVHNAAFHANKESVLGVCMDERMRSGTFARVRIIKK